MNREAFLHDLSRLINKHSVENGSNTPDWILAQYLVACLDAFDLANNSRDRWGGFNMFPDTSPAVKTTTEADWTAALE